MIVETIRRRAYILPFLVVLALCLGASAATAETFITIPDVPIDVTAKSAAAAREQAIAGVQAKAFSRLVKQLVADPAEQSRVMPSQVEIEGFVQDFAVQNERTSSVRYIGRYSIRFKSSRVRQYLKDSGIGAVADLTEVLVLPLYKGQNGPVLWDQGNQWRAAWEQGGFGAGPVTLILANGDAFDSASLSPVAASGGDVGGLSAIRGRYNAVGIVVAEAQPRDPAKGPASGLNLTLTTYDANGPKDTKTLTIEPMPGELSDKVLRRSVALASETLQTAWQQALAANGSIGFQASSLEESSAVRNALYSVAMPVTGIGDWIKVRDALSLVPGMTRVSLDALTKVAVAFTLDFYGDVVALKTALAERGLVLVQTMPPTGPSSGGFEIHPVTADASPAVAIPATPAVQ